MHTWPLQRDCAGFYGDPRGANGKASAKWERENLVAVKCPWELRYAGKPVSGIRVHEKCAASLSRVLSAVWDRCGKSQSEIDRIGMSIYGGGFNFRNVRGGSSLSMHSYGCAVDFDPPRNGLGDTSPAMDRRVIEEFEREGWEWGGHWSRTDGMHFQAARTKANPARLLVSQKVPSVQEIERLQSSLKFLGYHEVGVIDGKMGSRTRGALLAFKADNGLPLTEAVDADTWVAIATASPRLILSERLGASSAPSEAAKMAKGAEIAGGAAIAAGAADTVLKPYGGLSGIAEWVSGAGDIAGTITTALSPLRDLFGLLFSNWTVLLLFAGIAVFFIGRRVFKDELESYRKGEWS